tara:strand:+ start:185 stop:679 length:495 start_codon:yes stop_codon:yes gene_type:complete
MSLPQELVQQFQEFEKQYNLFIKKIATELVPSNCVEKGKTEYEIECGDMEDEETYEQMESELFDDKETAVARWKELVAENEYDYIDLVERHGVDCDGCCESSDQILEHKKNIRVGKIKMEDDDDEEQDFCGLLRAQAAQARADVNYNLQFEMSTEEYEKIKAEN